MSGELQAGIDGKSPEESGGHVLHKETISDLLKLNLGIGDALQLLDSPASDHRYATKLIGFLNKAGIVVSHPRQDTALLPVTDGQSFLVRGFSGRTTYEFITDVL